MLEGIEELDWSQWDHAYGPATDVPETLRALASPDNRQREQAQWKLYGNLWHQGTVYEATQHAVPFLLEILRDSPHVDRRWLMVYLAHLADGASYHDVHQHLSFYEEKRQDPEFQAQVREELSWVAAAAIAVVQGLSQYTELLEDEQPEVRAAACYLLASLPLEPQSLAERLRGPLADADEIVRASAGLALAWLDPEGVGDLGPTLDQFRQDPDPTVTWVGALLAARQRGDQVEDADLEVLEDAIRDPARIEQGFVPTPFSDVDVLARTSQVLPRIGAARAARAIEALLEALEQSDGYSALTIAEILLFLGLDGKRAPEGAALDGLPALAQRVLPVLATSSSAWTFDGNMSGMLRNWGLPSDAEGLQRYCGLEPRPRQNDTTRAVGPGGTIATATLELEEEQ